ncbi:MAG: c-type cytochrome [Pseudomonadota bacterium]|nr:c-type cytochrome [Pseudomonadota bacterium]
MKRFAKILAILAALVATAGGVGMYSGWYDVSATDEHLRPTYRMLDIAMRRSVRVRGADIPVPSLTDPAMAQRGLAIYRQNCVTCHGAPGVAPEPFALGMAPTPANLAHTAREWAAADLFWVVKHGLKMTGMPAWEFRLSDEELWATVAFLQRMPQISPQEYAALQAPSPLPRVDEAAPPDADRGKRAIHQYACLTCHAIPGLVGANAPVGPPLAGIGSRTIIAGVLPNNPDNMARWLRAPRQVNPQSAMPDLGVSERDARDIVAYLATLK